MNAPFAFMGLESPVHWLILAAIGILLFGKRLPEVGRSLGKGIVEFKKGLKGLEDEVDAGTSAPVQQAPALEPPRPPQRVTATAPKFEDKDGAVNTNVQPPPAV
jgi:sec-independent protein translocase protein TatA